MTPRIFHVLLIAVVLAALTACGTSTPRRAAGPPSEPALTRGDYEGLEPYLPGAAADISLVRVAELAARMDGYQPDLVLEILRLLESFSSGQLNTLADQQNLDPELTEWLELAVQVRAAAISGNASPAAAGEWAKYHYGHVVRQSDFAELVASYRAFFPAPPRVAVLLPTEGRLSAAAKAIRDGILSAYLDQPGYAVIRFYSSGQSSESAISAFRQATNDGARQIIGPLHIDSVRAIANLTGLPTPVLLLNDKTTGEHAPLTKDPGVAGNTERTDRLHSLSLATTQEAAAIATRALSQGRRDAIMIVPDSNWGKRIEAAFAAAFERGGGRILAGTRFDTTLSDHSAVLTQLLEIDASRQRKSDLQSWLGLPLSFEPTRRDDFDFIFMAASPVQGRELKPLLRFYDAGDVPVYAMSRIFSGHIEPTADQDLNGIIFPITRWQLEAADGTLITPASVRGGAYGNLYALGQDAWRLLPWLPLMQIDPDLWFPGEVGSLRLQVNGSLYRDPEWAQFSAGRPITFLWPPVDGN